MKLLTKNTDYAVRALLVLGASKGAYVSAREIAKAQHMPYQYLRRIIRVLIEEGIVEAREGGKGGVRLIKDPGDIHLTGILRIFQGKIQLSECMFRKRFCENRSKCPLRKRIQKAEKKLIKEFEGITIRTLLRDVRSEKIEDRGGNNLGVKHNVRRKDKGKRIK